MGLLSIKSVRIMILSRMWGDTLDNNYGLMDVFYDMGLCRELTAVAHAVPVHSTPGLSKYVIVIVVEDPLVVVIAHSPAQTKHNSDDSNICSDNVLLSYSTQRGSSKQSVLTHCLSGGGEVMLSAVVHMGKQGSGDQSV